MRQAALAALKQASGQLSSVEKTVTYTQVTGTPVYDPVTGSVSPSETDYPNVPVIYKQFTRLEKESQHVENGDVKVLIKLEDITFTPEIDDLIDDLTTTPKWRVKSKSKDTIDYMWRLHLTRV